MALLKILLFLFSMLLFASSSSSTNLALPVTKDSATLQYLTRIQQRTPSTNLNLTIDLGGRYLWLDCTNYASSTYRPVYCGTPQCKLTASQGCTDNNTCAVGVENPVLGSTGTLRQDALAISTTNGSVITDTDFIFACAPSFLLAGLPVGAKGMVGLGRGNLGLPLQLSHTKFTMCLPYVTWSYGVVFLGDMPGALPGGIEYKYTPLLVNPVSTAGSSVGGEKSVEYFIGVSSVKVNDKVVPLDPKLLSIDARGVGGTKISTVAPYSILESSIYKAVTGAFASAMGNVTSVAPVSPFKLCYNGTEIVTLYNGPAVPSIDLVLQEESVYWRILGVNSMVEAKKGVLCLGFVDGGVNPRTSIVIGGHQMEDNLLEFDVGKSRLGFTSTLWTQKTTCHSFN